MDANLVALIAAVLASIPGIVAVVRQVRKDRRVQPIEDNSLGIDASVSAASALKSYSDEVLKLRAELADMRAEIANLRRERDESRRALDEWQDGIRRLVAQLVSIGHVPVWQPEVKKS